MDSLYDHLILHQRQVRAGTDISVAPGGWWFLRACSGCGFVMGADFSGEIDAGHLAVIPPSTGASVRASVLGDMGLCQFGIRPEQLLGFFTADERGVLGSGVPAGGRRIRIIQTRNEAGMRREELCELHRGGCEVMIRAAMLMVAVRVLKDVLSSDRGVSIPPRNPDERLAELAAGIPESELLRHTAGDLARHCGCSVRHLRRLFAERFGASIIQRQITWRIEQAKRLLFDTDAKVIDIANECGFRSLGQFNKTFKRLTRQSPGAWRAATVEGAARRRRMFPPSCPRLSRAGR